MKTLYITFPADFITNRDVVDQIFEALMDAGVPAVVTAGERCLNAYVSTQHMADGEDPLALTCEALEAAGFQAVVTDALPPLYTLPVLPAANDPVVFGVPGMPVRERRMSLSA